MCYTQGTSPGELVQNQLELREGLSVTSDLSRVLLIARPFCFHRGVGDNRAVGCRQGDRWHMNGKIAV